MKSKNVLIKTLSLLFVIIYIVPVLGSATPSNFTNWPYYDKEVDAKAAFVMDADSSKVLYSLNPEQKLYPASLTKIMTAIIVLDNVNGNYDDLVTFSYNSVTKDIDKNSVTIGASAGDQLSIKDCLYSLLLPSANDAANALAEHIAGSINDFALLMNEKANNLGLKNTHFVNPSGLHDDNQYTTASDMAKILQYALSYPIFAQISSSVSYRHAPIRRYKNPENSNNQVLNTTSILVPGSGYYYNGIIAGKTGHTSNAGYNLAAAAKKNNMTLISIVLGCTKDRIRYQEAKSLFDFHFSNYKSLSIKNTDPRFTDSISTITINDVNLIDSLNITCDEKYHITMPIYADQKDITSKISFQVDDIYNKYAIGSVSYYLKDEFIGKCTLEGKNIEEVESIYTSHLNLSSPLSDDNENIGSNSLNHNPDQNNALVYRNSNGNLVLSMTLTTMIIVITILLSIIILVFLLYVFVLSNTNVPFNKIKFRFKRRLK